MPLTAQVGLRIRSYTLLPTAEKSSPLDLLCWRDLPKSVHPVTDLSEDHSRPSVLATPIRVSITPGPSPSTGYLLLLALSASYSDINGKLSLGELPRLYFPERSYDRWSRFTDTRIPTKFGPLLNKSRLEFNVASIRDQSPSTPSIPGQNPWVRNLTLQASLILTGRASWHRNQESKELNSRNRKPFRYRTLSLAPLQQRLSTTESHGLEHKTLQWRNPPNPSTTPSRTKWLENSC